MMLMDMSFTRDQAIKALKETDNNLERAVDWIFNHPGDMGGDDPEEAAEGSEANEAADASNSNFGDNLTQP